MKKFFLFAFILVLALGGWYNRFSIQKYLQKKLPKLAESPVIQQIREDISTPPPLIGSLFERETFLSEAGVVQWTNINRQQNGSLPALTRNSKLDASAQKKLDDMFAQQYFEHENPQGKGPSDLAKEVKYDYIAVGENLAMGNFDDDQDLVEAWMNSPGHRENILSTKYNEIGVAVGKGLYNGRKVWMAVQEFGRPSSDCPYISSIMKTEIDSLRKEVDSLQIKLTSLQQQLEAENPKTKEEYDAYNQKVADYNNQVKIYNNRLDQLKLLTEQYNAQVRAYNACLGK